MLRRGVKLQLVAFAVIAAVALGYGLIRFAQVNELVAPPYTVRAEFAAFGGIYPDAEVSLLGVPVGEVTALRPKPDGSAVTVDLRIDHGVRIPTDVTATVASKSAVGEQFVQLRPQRDGGPYLTDGGVIPASRTKTPLPVEDLLSNLNALAASLPRKEARIALHELNNAFRDTGPNLHRLLSRSNDLTRAGLDNLGDLIALIDNSATVLDTQVELGPQSQHLAGQLAGLTYELRGLNPEIAKLFDGGIRSAEQITAFLRENEQVVPALLDNLLAVNHVAATRLQGLRKTLVVFPYTVEAGLQGLRYCDDYDTHTGKPIAASCHYDPKTGEPIWSQHFAFQLPPESSDPPDAVCVKGYESTKRYHPNGEPASGTGQRERSNAPPNLNARCSTSPSDPRTPNVRGAQNAERGPDPGGSSSTTTTGSERVVVDSAGAPHPVIDHIGPPPPSGTDPLGWLMIGLLEQEVSR